MNIPGEDGVAGLVVSLTSMAYYGTMAGCYVPGIPSTYANKLYKVSVGYSGCRGICLSKCSQDNRLTKTKQKRVSTLQIGQIYRQFGWRWDYLCSIYMSFARLLKTDIKRCFPDLDMYSIHQFQIEALFRHAYTQNLRKLAKEYTFILPVHQVLHYL